MIDIKANRNSVKYTFKEKIQRVLWMIALPLFRFSPRPFFKWRNFLLKGFGAKVGRGVHIYNSAVVYFPWNLEIGDWSSIGEHAYIYNLGRIKIGKSATISHRAHLCAGTHDYTKKDMPLEKPAIFVGDQVWICADVFVGPGVKVHEGSVAGAGSVVTKNVDAWCVVAGNPARFIKHRVIKT